MLGVFFQRHLLLQFTEKQPVAVWNNMALVTATGEMFSPDKNTYPTSIPF